MSVTKRRRKAILRRQWVEELRAISAQTGVPTEHDPHYGCVHSIGLCYVKQDA